jgi:hypothetical protein
MLPLGSESVASSLRCGGQSSPCIARPALCPPIFFISVDGYIIVGLDMHMVPGLSLAFDHGLVNSAKIQSGLIMRFQIMVCCGL